MNPSPRPEPSAARPPRARRSLTLQLTLVVAVIVAVLLGVLLAAGNRFWREIMREEIDARLSAVAASRRDFVQEWIGRQKDRVDVFAKRQVLSVFLQHHVAGEPEEPERTYSQDNLKGHIHLGSALSARIVDLDGHVLLSAEPDEVGRDLTGDRIFQEGLKGPAVGRPEQAGGRFVSQIAAPVLPLDGRGAALGVVMLTVDVTALPGALRDTTGLGQTGEVLLGVREGGQIRYLFPPRYGDHTVKVTVAGAPAMNAALDGREQLAHNRDYRGEPVLAAGRSIGYGGWGLVAKIDEAEAYAPIARALRYGLGLGALIMLVGLVAAWALARRFTHPIVRLADAAESVARGNLDIAVPVTSKSEAGQLTARFNDMTAALRARSAERKASEIVLREKEHFLQRVTDVTPGVVHVFDLERKRNVFINRTVASVLHYSPDEVQAMGSNAVPTLMHPDDLPRFEEHIRRIRNLADGEIADFEHRMRDRSGEWHWFHSRDTVFARDAAGGVRQAIGASIEITGRKRAEEEIRRLNAGLEQRVRERTAQLETANKELEAFSYSVSHDLRAPLRAVNGFVRMLQEGHAAQLDAEGHRLLGVVTSEANRMGRLIDDLLAFSRMGRQRVTRANIDMTELARTEFENLTRAAPESAPRLDLKPLPQAHGDPAMLRQVFANLLGNAVKFTRKQPAPVIEVGGASDNGATTYYVKDNGAGFDERYSNKLFGVFQRLHSDSEFEGTGVGLALVQRIIHRHSGKVWADGKPGEGATFYFSLPDPVDRAP